jgi:hypothetical protein
LNGGTERVLWHHGMACDPECQQTATLVMICVVSAAAACFICVHGCRISALILALCLTDPLPRPSSASSSHQDDPQPIVHMQYSNPIHLRMVRVVVQPAEDPA